MTSASRAVSLAWAGGTLGSSTMLGAMSLLVLFFLTEQLGIAPALAGTLIFVARLWDICAALAIGQWSDRSEGRWGRRAPFLFAGAPLAALSYLMLFAVPQSLAGPALHAWVLAALIGFATGYSLFVVPYLAVPAEITSLPAQRTTMMSWRVAFMTLAGLNVAVFGALFIKAFGGGRPGYAGMGAMHAVVILAAMWTCAFVVARSPTVARADAAQGGSLAQIARVLRYRPLRVFLGVKLFQLTAVASTSASLLYLARYVLGRDESFLVRFGALQLAGTMLSLPAWSWLGRRHGKRVTYMWAGYAYAMVSLSWLTAALGEPGWVTDLRLLMIGVGSAGLLVMGFSLLPDIMAQYARAGGEALEGTIAAVYNIVEKGTAAVGPLLGGLLLSASGFISAAGGALPRSQPPAAISAILLLAAVIPATFNLFGSLLLRRFTLGDGGVATSRGARAISLAIAALCLAGIVTSPATSAAAERTFHRTGTDDPATVDPHKIAFPGEQLVVLDLFMGLTTSDIRGGRPVPGCAESWTISPDGRSYVFRLRPNLQWSDGAPLTSADFVWSFRRALDPKTAFPFASRLYPIRNARLVASGKAPLEALGVSAPDPRTVRIDLEGPTPYFTDVIASIGVPAPRHAIEKFGSAWIRPQNFVGNGPFTLDRWVPNAYLRLRKNPRFFAAGQVRLDAVHHYPVENPVTMVRRFQSGGLDLVYVVPPERVDWARREFGRALRVGRGTANEVLVFNTRRGPTADVRVRRALSMAMDRTVIANNVIGFPGVDAWGYVPPGVANYGEGARPDFAAWSQPQRDAEARRLLEQAGYGAARPLKLRLSFPNTELNRKVAVTIATMWRRLGVVPELAQKETKSLVADVARGDFDAARFVWLAGFSDPYAFLERMLSTGSAVGVNASRYANPEYDALLQRATQEVDLGRRAAILRQAEALALADQPVAPVYYLVGRRLVSPRVTGFVDNPRGLYPSWYMSVPPR